MPLHVKERVREKLRLYDTFHDDNEPLDLTALDQGETTSAALSKLLAKFAGVPSAVESKSTPRPRKFGRGGLYHW